MNKESLENPKANMDDFITRQSISIFWRKSSLPIWAKLLTALSLIQKWAAASCAASITLGTTIGILTKNQQAAAGATVPIAVILGFTPMIANFNGTVKKLADVLYTQQLNVIVNDFSANFAKAILTIGINIAVLLVLFVLVYKKKGLK